MNDTAIAATGRQPVIYCVETDTMAIEIRPWPGREDDDAVARCRRRSRHPRRTARRPLALGNRACLAPPCAHRRGIGRAAPTGRRRSLNSGPIRSAMPQPTGAPFALGAVNRDRTARRPSSRLLCPEICALPKIYGKLGKVTVMCHLNGRPLTAHLGLSTSVGESGLAKGTL